MKKHYKIFSILYARIVFLTLIFLTFFTYSLFSQEFLKNIDKKKKKGKAKDMCIYLDKYVDLSFSEKTNRYSKKQAEVIIQNFFNKVEPKDFYKIQKGSSNANSSIFYIGTLNTSNGLYQVYLFFVIKNATYFLKEIRFEKE